MLPPTPSDAIVASTELKQTTPHFMGSGSPWQPSKLYKETSNLLVPLQHISPLQNPVTAIVGGTRNHSLLEAA